MNEQIIKEVEESRLRNQREISPTAVYGFIVWTLTYVVFFVVGCWVLLPDSWMNSMGITYIVNKEYAITITLFFCVTFLLIIFLYPAYNMIKTHPPYSYYTLVDKYTKIKPMEHPKENHQNSDEFRIPEVYDIPITVVNKVLYEKNPFEAKRDIASSTTLPETLNRAHSTSDLATQNLDTIPIWRRK